MVHDTDGERVFGRTGGTSSQQETKEEVVIILPRVGDVRFLYKQLVTWHGPDSAHCAMSEVEIMTENKYTDIISQVIKSGGRGAQGWCGSRRC